MTHARSVRYTEGEPVPNACFRVCLTGNRKQPTRARKLTLDRMIVRPVSPSGNARIGVDCDYNHCAGNVTGISVNGAAARIGRMAGDDEDLNG